MMADLVDHHMADDVEERLAGLAPVVEQWPAVEEDHVVGAPHDIDAAARQGDAAIEAENVEGRLELHLPLDIYIGKILDAEDDIGDMSAERGGDGEEGLAGEALD